MFNPDFADLFNDSRVQIQILMQFQYKYQYQNRTQQKILQIQDEMREIVNTAQFLIELRSPPTPRKLLWDFNRDACLIQTAGYK